MSTHRFGLVWQAPTPLDGTVTFELTNGKGDPVPDTLITLRLYSLVGEDLVDETPVGSCLTDAAGSCTLTVRNPDYSEVGVTAFVQVADESIAIVWPGGDLRLPLHLSSDGRLIGPGHAPYEGQDAATLPPTLVPLSERSIVYRGPETRSSAQGLWLSLVAIVLGLSVIGWALWRRRR